MKILKFGGTSVSSKNNLNNIVHIVKNELENDPVIVVSALSGVTNLLEEIQNDKSDKNKILNQIRLKHENLINDVLGDSADIVLYDLNLKLQELLEDLNIESENKSDKIFSYGEIISSGIVTFILKENKIKSSQIISTELIVTDSNFGNAEFNPELTKEKVRKNILPLIEKNIIPVITGFIGSDVDGNTTTLGRGGSDYSASIIGYSIDASEIQIWTDVDGVCSADPRIINNTKLIRTLTFKEANELAAFGAKVLHPRSIRPAYASGIPVRIKNTGNINSYGTLIIPQDESVPGRVLSVASKKDITLVNIYSTEMLLSKGFLQKIFEIFAKNNISIDLVSVSEVSVSVTLDNDDNLQAAINQLNSFTKTTYEKAGLISIIGNKILDVKYLTRDLFSILEIANVPIKMISMGASDINISLVVDSEDLELAVTILHNGLIAKKYKPERRYL